MPRNIEHHEFFSEPLLTRKRGFSVKQGVIEKYRMNLQTYDGSNLDINDIESEFGITAQIESAFMEASRADNFLVKDTNGSIIDKSTGEIEFQIPQEVYSEPAIYLGEIAVKDADGKCYAINEIYLYVEPSHQTSRISPVPLISEIRLSLRDSSFIENELLGNYEFDVAEISYAATRVVQTWNEMPPPTGSFTTRNFPLTNLWLNGIHLYLFDLLQEHYRRNQFSYSAGGFTVDDRNKFQLYRLAWMDKLNLFMDTMRRIKRRFNSEDGFAEVPGPYGLFRTV